MKFQILIADDEPALLKVMTQYLRRIGYDVDACLTGAEAWDRFEARSGRYSLFVSDATLRGAGPPALLERMFTLNASIVFLVCSGYPFDLNSLSPAVRERTAFLQKPFTPSMLASAVSALLDSARGGAGTGAA